MLFNLNVSIVVETIIVCICGLISLRSELLAIQVIITLTFIAKLEYQSINSLLHKTLKMSHKATRRQVARLCRTFHAYRSRHTANTRFIMHCNAILISKFGFAFIVGTTPFNVYTVVMLAFRPLPDHVRIFFLTLLFVQSFTASMLLAVASVNNSMHGSVRWLQSLLARLGPANHGVAVLREHWKSMAYYELLHRNTKQLALTIGSFGAITHKEMFDVRIDSSL